MTRSARLEDLWHAHAPQVQAYAYRHTRSEDVPDIVAEVFLTAWRRIDDVPEDAVPWLLATARNVMGTAMRSRSRKPQVPVDPAVSLRTLASDVPNPADLAADRDHLLAALASLSQGDREALLLVAWDGLTNAQAARVLGISEGTFRVRLSRARARLDALFNGKAP